MDWVEHLHAIRRREFDAVFGRVPDHAFGTALELGAGDAYQSRLLARCAQRVTSTDFWGAPAGEASPTLEYLQCDADEVASRFRDRRFDLVFSSNMLEHIEDPQLVLAGIRDVLAPSGVSIHVMPTPFWKLTHLMLFWPARVRGIIRAVRARGSSAAPQTADRNNPKLAAKPGGREWLWPHPHGAKRSNRAEFAAFRRQTWREQFRRAGFHVIAEIDGPVASGYGFGLESPRRFLEGLGLTSEIAYVTRLADGPSPFDAIFEQAERNRN